MLRIITGVWVLLGLAACGVVSVNSNVNDAQVQKRYANQTVEKVMEHLTVRMTKVKSERLELYSPNLFAKAGAAFAEAQSAYFGKSAAPRVLRLAYVADKNLDDALQVKRLASSNMRDVFDAIEQLEAKNISPVHRPQYNTVLSKTARLVETLEERVQSGGAVDIRAMQFFDADRKALINYIHGLKIQVVRFNLLEKPLESLQAFISDAKQYAPKTYTVVEQSRKTAEEVIARQVDDKAAVAGAVKAFVFSVKHALHVTQAVMKLRQLSPEKFEDYVLDLERKLIPIGNALETGDLRDTNFYEQTIRLAKAAGALSHTKTKLEHQKTVAVTAAQTGAETASTAKAATTAGSVDAASLRQAKEDADKKVKKLTQQIADLQFRVKGLKRSERPLKDKIWLLEQRVNELGVENQRLNKRLSQR